MGKPHVEKLKRKHRVAFIIVFIVSIVTVIFLLNTFPTMKRQLIRETEDLLQTKLPSVASYESISFENWSNYNDYFPERMIIFTFEEKAGLTRFFENTIESEQWSQELSNDMFGLLPQSVKPYALSNFPSIFINLENHDINIIPLDEGEYQFAYVCCDMDNRLLMVFYFKGVIGNEE